MVFNIYFSWFGQFLYIASGNWNAFWTGMAYSLLAKGEDLGLEGYDQSAKGLAMVWHSSM